MAERFSAPGSTPEAAQGAAGPALGKEVRPEDVPPISCAQTRGAPAQEVGGGPLVQPFSSDVAAEEPVPDWPLSIDRQTLRSAIIDLTRDGIFVCDRQYRIWEIDDAFVGVAGRTRAEILGHTVEEVLGKDVFELRKPSIDAAFAGRASQVRGNGLRPPTMGRVWEVYHQPVFSPGGRIECVLISVRDVTRYQRLDDRLTMYEEIVRQTSDRVSVIGLDYRYKLTNMANARFYKRKVSEIVGCHVRDLIGAERFEGRAKANLDACFSGQSLEYEHSLALADDKVTYLHVRMEPYRERDGTISGAVVVLRDVTAASLLARKLRRQAREDALTGLANRYALLETLEGCLERVQSSGGSAALISIDLDGFKIINDRAGHSAGDALLCQIADMLRTFAEEEGISPARLGGDEFAVVLKRATRAGVLDLGNRILANLVAMQFIWQGERYSVSASAGIAMIERRQAEEGPISVFDVLNRADQACLFAKEVGGARAIVYRPDASEMVAQRVDIGNLQVIKQALEQDALQLYTMPIRPVVDGGRAFREVLLRFVDEDGRVVAPAALISSAERHGLMPRIDRWVVTTALRHIDEVEAGVTLTINLSGQSIGDPDFKDFLVAALDERPEVARRLAFEITETAAVRSMSTAQSLIGALRTRGCGVILDDFGSGLSSFVYLRQFPIDSLKIDGAIIGSVAEDEVQQTIVAGIVAVARKIGVEVIAEYVEDARMLETLRRLGVTAVQGYHIGRPEPWVAGSGAMNPAPALRKEDADNAGGQHALECGSQAAR